MKGPGRKGNSQRALKTAAKNPDSAFLEASYLRTASGSEEKKPISRTLSRLSGLARSSLEQRFLDEGQSHVTGDDRAGL